ncbi:MAG: 16S rRNA (guanine(966)-N(2))-methyltransferase RsmD [Alphaproteobacteria bacterium]|jgi:16S rRNA (guanine966-N2)-methyltransferase|nr:16S rRNA (guanine(966)-N(2))-methyltransferase RsmD [Alphaproteobacteria bacterium]
MRIVGGRHKGRRLASPSGPDVRPTSDRTRESLFDIIVHAPWTREDAPGVAGAVVLDAFAGTGALGLEALSRGAARAYFFETDRRALATLRRNIDTLAETAACRVLAVDATRPPPAPEPVHFAFFDPPYGRDLAPPALAALAARGWLSPGTLCVIETDARDDVMTPEAFSLLDARRYSRTALLFLRYTGA